MISDPIKLVLLCTLYMFNSSAEHDAQKPLLLTRYINEGKIDEARRLAKNKPWVGETESYSGFLTVNKTANSNLFIWYFAAEEDDGEAPVAVWLNGDPGCSSLFGEFFQIGPYALTDVGIHKREVYWSKRMHVLFIDNPVGTGFSFTTNDYPTDVIKVSKYLFTALTQFYQLFSELRTRSLYLMGASYGGKYISALGHAIHFYNGRKSNGPKINLKGIAIGNGLIDPINQLVQGPYMYQVGLIDDNQLLQVQKLTSRIAKNIKARNWEKATAGFKELFWSHEGEPTSLLQNNTGFTSYNSILVSHNESFTLLKTVMEIPDVKQNLHVGNLNFSDGKISEKFLFSDIMKSVLPWFKEMLVNYDVLLYSGQLDIILPYPAQEAFLRKMPWLQTHKYLDTTRKIWRVGDEIAGYAKTLYHKKPGTKELLHFTHILVRNAGHRVPTDQPEAAFDMITRFTSEKYPF